MPAAVSGHIHKPLCIVIIIATADVAIGSKFGIITDTGQWAY